MSLLTPLYVLGLLAISLPIVFHLIRRMPKGEFPFSSLMFLSPSPPRLTRRSRIEHWLLLLLRALAIGLLAVAFARPFWRQITPVEPADGDLRRVAVLIDTSASMKRGDLWPQARREVDAVLQGARPFDQIAVYACDDTLRPLVSFEEMAEIPLAQRRDIVNQRLSTMEPTFAGTHLGRGLIDLVEIVNNVPNSKNASADLSQQIVLVSDLQEGARLDELADYPWPDDVHLELRTVKASQPTNAGLHWLAERSADVTMDGQSDVRVRVSNDAASSVDRFQLTWQGDDKQPIGEPIAAYVPAGESRVLRVPRPTEAKLAGHLQLTGDACEFDNTLYLASRTQAETSVAYLGSESADDPGTPRFYVERVLAAGLTRPVELVVSDSGEPLKLESATTMPLVVVTSSPTDEQTRALRQYVEAGGTVLFVMMHGVAQGQQLAALLGVSAIDVVEADVDNYAMLGQIAFDHPLFAPMSGPQFNDFTQIHFWRYRRLNREQLGDATVVARFESGDPALVERRLGKGQVYVLTSGWQPSDSELARSWKFVLFFAALVEGRQAGTSDRVYYVVGEPVQVGDDVEVAGDRSVMKPDGDNVLLANEATEFRDTDQPGLYSIATVEGPLSFAVNLDPVESRTSPLSVEALEQLGCRLVSHDAIAHDAKRREQLRDVQLENRQKLWQWLVLGALGVLVTETWLAGRATKQSLAKPVTE